MYYKPSNLVVEHTIILKLFKMWTTNLVHYFTHSSIHYISSMLMQKIATLIVVCTTNSVQKL